MHNRRGEAETNEWMAKALARAARRKLYYDAGLAASPALVSGQAICKQSHSVTLTQNGQRDDFEL